MKKTNLLQSVCCLAVGAWMVFGLVSCSPEDPVNEIEHKLHEDPFKAVLTLQEGTLVGGKFNEKPKMEHFKPSAASSQIIVWEIIAGKGWTMTGDIKGYKVKNLANHPETVYFLKFDYFNKDGKLMNYQFFDNGQDKIHQHFFTIYREVMINGQKGNVKVTKKSELPFDYNYADVYHGNYIADTNPMGFQGFIRFVKPGAKFNLMIELLHATQSKLENDGTPSPFYLPSTVNLTTGLWDINIGVPVEVEE